MQVTDAMVAAARKIIWGRDHNHLHGDDLISAALTAALAEMWQSMDSAPKDGSEFLAFGGGVEGDKGIQTVRWCERVGCWETPTASLEDWDNQAEGYSRPTHFMPLPAPPRGE